MVDLSVESIEAMKKMAEVIKAVTDETVFLEAQAATYRSQSNEFKFRLSIVTNNKECYANDFNTWDKLLDAYKQIVFSGDYKSVLKDKPNEMP